MKKILLPIIIAAVILAGSCNPLNTFPRDLYEIDTFVHPGIMHTPADLIYLESMTTSGNAIWNDAYAAFEMEDGDGDILTDDIYSSSSYVFDGAFPNVHRDGYGTNRIGDPDMLRDADAAYANALQWIIKENVNPTEATAHAEKAVQILNGWSGTLESITGDDDGLMAGMAAHKFCNAAEIIRHTTPDGTWPDNDVEQFKTMLMTVFYPLIDNMFDHYPFSNGNWGLSMVNSVMAIAVFCDDKEMFYDAIVHVADTRQIPYSTMSGYIDANTGQAQESGRDQGHSQMGLGFLVAAGEIAWNQGIDLYGYLDNRLMKGIEYTAKYNLGYDVPYYQMYGRTETYPGEISYKSRGNFAPIYEACYDHYVNEKGYEMPYTRILLENIGDEILIDIGGAHRPEGNSSAMTSWGTLTQYRP